jgi:ABC-type uncharacterized transport system substrate-binding protein
MFFALSQLVRPILVATILTLVALTLTGESWAQNKAAKVGVLTIAEVQEWLKPFARRLRELGWIEGKNVQFEYRNAGGDPTRFAEPVSELVKLNVDVLLAMGPPAVREAFAATRDIPIVAHDLETDPVAAGYARSYARPGGNLTGLFLDSPNLAGKWLELLTMIVPNLSRVVVLWDATSGPIPLTAVRNVAPSLGINLQILDIHGPDEIDNAPSAFRGRPQALVILPSPMMHYQSARLARLARKQRLPATSMFVLFAEAGGMLAYGPEMTSTAERCAELVAKILAGTKPGNLPIERPSNFEFVFNLKTAKALRLTVPDTVLLRADKIIR